MELELEARKVEDAEHGFLDNLMVELETCPATVEDGEEWEASEYTDLEQALVEEPAGARDDILDAMMHTYLANTNLLSKRMVGATVWVEPHQSESEQSVGDKELCLGYKDIILSQDNKTQEDNVCLTQKIYLCPLVRIYPLVLKALRGGLGMMVTGGCPHGGG